MVSGSSEWGRIEGLIEVVMQFEGLVCFFHQTGGQLPQFLDEAYFIHGAGLVNHDLGPDFQPPRCRRDLYFKGIDAGYIGGYRRNGDNGRMQIVYIVGHH